MSVAVVKVTDQQVDTVFETFNRLGLVKNNRKSYKEFVKRMKNITATETDWDIFSHGFNGVSAAVYGNDTTKKLCVTIRNSQTTHSNPQLAEQVKSFNNKLTRALN